MAKTVADVMTAGPATIDAAQPVSRAAELMAEHDTGAVVVTKNGKVSGIVTDRDIAVRVVAKGHGPDTPVERAASDDLTTVTPATELTEVVRLMREQSVRRLPVIDGDNVVGVVSIGDLAIERDSDSALADISAARGNR